MQLLSFIKRTRNTVLKKELRTALKVYLSNWVLLFILFSIAYLSQDFNIKAALKQYYKLLFNPASQVFQHLCFIAVYLLFLTGRYFIRTFKRKGWRTGLRQLALRFILPIIVLFVGVRAVIHVNSVEFFDYTWDYAIENTSGISKDLYAHDGKHRGMSVFSRRGDYASAVDVLVKDNIEWVAVIPFMYQETERTKALNVPEVQGQFSRRDSSFIRKIKILHDKGVHVQLKPHVWMSEGWRSNITLSEGDWDIWFASYRTNMLRYARMAQELQVQLFCVGTELRTAIKERPELWKTLIQEIKAVYTGKLTYAANWDDPIETVPFWDQMDYIGIQAYFPLTENKNPSLEQIKVGWEQHLPQLEQAAKRYKKPILFTEVGYRSDHSATVKPWEWGSYLGVLSEKKSDETQQLAYEALFQQLWDKPWFAGCYIWQWHTNTTAEAMKKNVDFTPRFKPAENTIAKWYGALGRETTITKD